MNYSTEKGETMKRYLSMLAVAIGLSAAVVAVDAQPADPTDPPAVTAPAEPEATPAPAVAPEAPAAPAPAAPVVEAPATEAAPTAPESASDAPSTDDPLGLASKALNWAMNGEYGLAATAAFMLLVFGIRLALGWEKLSFLAWFKTRWGGWALNLGGSTAAAMLTGQLAGQSLSIRLALAGLVIGFAAAGGVEFFKDMKKGNKPAPAAPPPTPA